MEMRWLFSRRLPEGDKSDPLMIVIQQQDFNTSEEIKRLQEMSSTVGAVATFVGIVRDFEGQAPLCKLLLEHYPGMTESRLESISVEARKRWKLIDISIIHRVGELMIGDQIVFVGVASEHRQDAFSACQFVMDYLKTDVPIWKKAFTEEGEYWIDAKSSDGDAMDKWT